MRRIFTLIGCCITVVGFSQLQVGTRLLSGQFDLSTNNVHVSNPINEGSSKNVSAGVSLGLQKMDKPNRIRGAEIGYAYSRFEQLSANPAGGSMLLSESRLHRISVGYLQQHWIPFSSKLFGTISLRARVAHARGNNLSNDQAGNLNLTSIQREWGISLGLSPGLTYLITSRWIADIQLLNFAAIAYSNVRFNSRTGSGPEVAQTQNRFDASTLLSGTSFFSLGFRYLLR